jgi:hypothetical protein
VTPITLRCVAFVVADGRDDRAAGELPAATSSWTRQWLAD